MSHTVFLSYARADQDIAELVYQELEKAGIDCWAAFKRLSVAGEVWSDSIVEAIESSKVLLLLYSRQSNESGQVLREVERAVSARVTIAPILLDETPLSRSMQYYLGAAHWLVAKSTTHVPKLAAESVIALLASGRSAALLPTGIAPPLGALRMVYTCFGLFGASSAVTLYLMFFNQFSEEELVGASFIWAPCLIFGVYGLGWGRDDWRKSLGIALASAGVLAVFFITLFNFL